MSHCFAAITTISVKLSLFCKIKTIWFVKTAFVSVTLAVLDLTHAGIKGGTTTTRHNSLLFQTKHFLPFETPGEQHLSVSVNLILWVFHVWRLTASSFCEFPVPLGECLQSLFMHNECSSKVFIGHILFFCSSSGGCCGSF